MTGTMQQDEEATQASISIDLAQRVPLTQKFLEVGDHLPDGTVVLSVNPDKDEALFVPEKIFGGKATLDRQGDVIESANCNGVHGHSDWRGITDAESKMLSKVWDKVAPVELQGDAAPWFWLPLPNHDIYGFVRKGGEEDWDRFVRYDSRSVPLIRSGPAWVLDI